MKMPNFRLPETQATTSVWLGLLGFAMLGLLAVTVGWRMDWENRVIPYNAQHLRGKLRPYIVYAFSAASVGVGGLAGILGFSSLGKKRNSRQGQSWMGLLSGALVMSFAPLLLIVWMRMSQTILVGTG